MPKANGTAPGESLVWCIRKSSHYSGASRKGYRTGFLLELAQRSNAGCRFIYQ